MTTTKKFVAVDAGMNWIGDPCYVMGQDASHGVENWNEFCERMDDLGSPAVSEPLGDGVGVAVQSGYGDGRYEVEVETCEDGATPKRVTITFVD